MYTYTVLSNDESVIFATNIFDFMKLLTEFWMKLFSKTHMLFINIKLYFVPSNREYGNH